MQTAPELKIGYLKIADHLIMEMTAFRESEGEFDFRHLTLAPTPMNNFQQLIDALVQSRIQGAFIPIPAAMDLVCKGLNIKLVLFTHRSGSVMVQAKSIQKISDFRDKSILLPYPLSMQTMLAHKLFASAGMVLGSSGTPGIDVAMEIVSPYLMPDMMAQDDDGDIGGYFVAEPFGSQTLITQSGNMLCTSDRLFKQHPCCAFVLTDDVIQNRPDAADELIRQLIRSGHALEQNDHPGFFNQMRQAWFPNHGTATTDISILLKTCHIRYEPGLLVPDRGILQMIMDYMHRSVGILPQTLDLGELVLENFAHQAVQELDT